MIHGPVLEIPDSATLCIALDQPPRTWVPVSLRHLATTRPALMAAAFGQNATCIMGINGTGRCRIEGRPLAGELRRPRALVVQRQAGGRAAVAAIAPVPSPSPNLWRPSAGPAGRYPIASRLDVPGPKRDDWGAFATTDGHAADPWAQSGWAREAGANRSAVHTGLGWPRRDPAAVVGYAEPDFATRPDVPHGRETQSAIGFSLVLR